MSTFTMCYALNLLPILLRIIQAEQELQIFPFVISLARLAAKIFRWAELKIGRMNVLFMFMVRKINGMWPIFEAIQNLT